MLNRKYQTACGYEPRQHLLKLWAKWCENIWLFLKVDEKSISDRGSECWPHDLHRAAQCWSCPFGCLLSVPVCSSCTEAESGASSAAGCDREKASYPGRWAFFFSYLFWCFQWQTMSQYACKHPGLSKQERPEPRPGGYDLKIYGPRGGAVPRLTSLIIDEAHQRVQCHGEQLVALWFCCQGYNPPFLDPGSPLPMEPIEDQDPKPWKVLRSRNGNLPVYTRQGLRGV